MATPTIDHQEHPDRGACACSPWKLCAACMGKLKQMRHDWAIREWLRTWDKPGPRNVVRGRPVLRLVTGAR